MAYVRPVFDRKADKADPNRRPIGYEVRYRDGDGVQRTKGGFRRKRDADAWLRSVQGRRRPKTADGYEQLLDLHVRPAFAHRKVASISYADVDAFVRSLEASGRRPGTVRNAFFVLKMVLDFAIKDGKIRSNPCAGVELPSAASPEMLFLTAAQVRALAAAIDERWSSNPRARIRRDGLPPFGLLVEFAAFTGLRAGEISALRIGGLDLRAGTVFVSRSASLVKGRLIEGAPKTRAGRRTVFLNRTLGDKLRLHLADRLLDRDGYVFAAPDGGPFNYATFYGLHFKPAVRAVLPEHLHGLRFHDLRHTYASLLVEQGAHPKEMAELLGHSSVQITLDRYSHVMPHMAAALAERMDAVYRAADPGHATDTIVGSVTPLN